MATIDHSGPGYCSSHVDNTAEDVHQRLAAANYTCDEGHVHTLAAAGFNWANIFVLAIKDGPLAVKIIKDIADALSKTKKETSE